MIIVLALVVLGGAGGGSYYYFILKDKMVEEDTASHDAKADEHGKSDGHDKKNSGFFNKTQYVKLSPLYLPLLDDNGDTQIISVGVTLAVPGEGAAEKVKYMAPKLHDAYIQNMYGILNNTGLKNGLVPVQEIKQRLKEVSYEVAGEELIEDVLLQFVTQRRM
jgi:flagellar FliL protein